MLIDSIRKGLKTVFSNVMALIFILLCLAVFFAPIYAAAHFIAKYW